MAPDKSNPFFKDPHSYSASFGRFDCEVDFVTSKKFPSTCTACSNFANTWSKDHQSYQKGANNFTASLEKLLQLLDVFIREKSKGKETAGQRHHYSLSNECDFTIRLLWQLRHVIVHNGAVIDNRCKKNYERIYRKREENIRPIIDLPDVLEVGQGFIIQYDDYKKVRECIFNYIKRQVQEEDYSIFIKRASIADFHMSDAFVTLSLEGGKLTFNIQTAADNGIDIDPKSGIVTPPADTTFSFKDNRIHLKNGNSFPAKYIPDSQHLDDTIFD